MWGVYTYRPPQKGVGPPVALVPMPGKRSLVSHFWTRVPRQLSHCWTRLARMVWKGQRIRVLSGWHETS